MSETQSTEQQESTLIFVKSASQGEDSKGREKLDLRFSEEETATLKEELSKVNSRAKFQIHIDPDGTYGPSVFMFIKEVQQEGTYKTSKSAKTSSSNNDKSKIERLKNK